MAFPWRASPKAKKGNFFASGGCFRQCKANWTIERFPAEKTVVKTPQVFNQLSAQNRKQHI